MGVLNFPAVEVLGLLVVVVEHLREHLGIAGVAEALRTRPYPFLGILLDGEVGHAFAAVLHSALGIPDGDEIRF